jgi:hypothetical protein
MEITIDMKWKLNFAAAVAAGVDLFDQQKIAEIAEQQQAAAALAQIWADYDAEVRAGLPEVLRPLMTPLRDDSSEPCYTQYTEDALLDGEPYGLAPIVARMEFAMQPGEWGVKEYLVMGICECTVNSMRRYCFSEGDEYFVVEPAVVKDMSLALGMAHERFSKKTWLENMARQNRAEDLQYVPDSQEVDELVEKALAASVRAIVRDEMCQR